MHLLCVLEPHILHYQIVAFVESYSLEKQKIFRENNVSLRKTEYPARQHDQNILTVGPSLHGCKTIDGEKKEKEKNTGQNSKLSKI